MNNNLWVKMRAQARIPTEYGEFQLCLYENSSDDEEHLAFVKGDVANCERVLVRVHSECFTGDVLGSQRCDCGEQLDAAMRVINEAGHGVVLYLRQEGRGIGLLDKLRAYNLQDEGYDTVDANLMLGHGADERDYTIAALILADLKIKSVKLLTNNPTKIEALKALGIHVYERQALEVPANQENFFYLQTKAQRMRHKLRLDASILKSLQQTGS